MADRYFSEEPIAGARATLVGAEAHHLLHVMRAKPGVRVMLFDGEGAEFWAEVERTQRDRVELVVRERREIDREAARDLTLAVALPKGDRQRWLIEKATELGVKRVVPILTERGVSLPGGNALDRLRRAVIEASKQCGRNLLMEIAEPVEWTSYLRDEADALRLIAHPGHGEATAWREPTESSIAAAIGPEGGFTDDEVERALAAGWRPVQLGRRILRVETAALAIAAIALAEHS